MTSTSVATVFSWFQLVSNSKLSTHSKKCVGGAAVVRGSEDTPMPVDNPSVEALPFHQPDPSLPTFEEVCLLNQPTLCFIPLRSRPAFARALSSALTCVILETHGSNFSCSKMDALCNMWIDNDLGSLWNLAKGRVISLIHQSTSSIRQRIDMANSLGRSGMFGKACRILLSSGIAPNNENTWQHLKAKHPSCPAPVVPVVQSTETITLQPDFNILSVLQSFPKDTAAGPSGLRVQHLFDVANILPYAHLLGAEKVTHGLRICIEEHWSDDDFVAFKDKLVHSLGFNRGIPWVPYSLHWPCKKLISGVDADDECMDLLYQAWYLDDAVMCSLLPNLDILGAPVGDYLHCSRFIADKCAESKKLLTSLVDVAGVDLQVAFTLLCMCGGFCKLVHLTRVTPPSLASDALVSFDEDVRQCFVLCSAIEVSDTAWKQAQLSLRFGGLGLCSLSCHGTAAYIASLSLSSLDQSNNHHLQQAVIAYNSTAESALASPT
ncbi:hypothetical protein EMCRGX_G011720 [Ephydatia muelleri]